MSLESLITKDQEWLTWFNGSDSLILDRMVETLTAGLTWVPLYIALFYLVVKNNETMKQIALIVGCVALCMLLSDGVTDGLVKPLVARWRPSHDPIIKYTIDIVNNHRNTYYGFFSAHAANTMAITVFFCLLVRSKLFCSTMILWSLLNCWTRMYLGLHYPGDIFFGLLRGSVAGGVSYMVFHNLYFKFNPDLNYISSQYTSTGYSMIDIDIVMSVIVMTLAGVMIYSLLTVGLF